MESREVREWVRRELKRGEDVEVIKQSLGLLGIEPSIVDEVKKELLLSKAQERQKGDKEEEKMQGKEENESSKNKSREEEGKGKKKVHKDEKNKPHVSKADKGVASQSSKPSKSLAQPSSKKENNKNTSGSKMQKKEKQKSMSDAKGHQERNVIKKAINIEEQEDVRFNVPAELVPRDLDDRLKGQGRELVNVVEKNVRDIKRYSALLLVFLLFTLFLIFSYLFIFIK